MIDFYEASPTLRPPAPPRALVPPPGVGILGECCSRHDGSRVLAVYSAPREPLSGAPPNSHLPSEPPFLPDGGSLLCRAPIAAPHTPFGTRGAGTPKPSDFCRIFIQACNTDPDNGTPTPEKPLRRAGFRAWLFTGADVYAAYFREFARCELRKIGLPGISSARG